MPAICPAKSDACSINSQTPLRPRNRLAQAGSAVFNQGGNFLALRRILHPLRGKAHPLCAPVQQQHNLFMGDIVAAWSDDRVFRNGHWIFDDAPDELRTVHYVAGGQFYAIGKGSKFDHGPGQD